MTDESNGRSVPRREFLTATGAVTLGGLAGCSSGDTNNQNTTTQESGDDTDSDTTTQGAPDSPMDISEFPPADYSKSLNVWNWYTAWSEWAVPQFEKDYGMDDVTLSGYSSPDQWYAKLQSENHSIDNISGSVILVQPSVEEGLLQPLPVDKMSGYQDLIDPVKKAVEQHATKDGEVYALPQSTVVAPVLGYNEEYFDSEPDSWDYLWDEDLKGKVFMWGFSNVACMIAARYTGQDWHNPDDYEDIKEALIQQKPLNKTYWTSHEQAMQMFINEEVVVGPHTRGRMYNARFNHDAPVHYSIPKEGGTFNMDELIMPKIAPNPIASAGFIDWATQPENAKHMFLKNGYMPPQKGVEDALLEHGVPEEEVEFMKFPSDENIEFEKPLPEDVRKRYDQIWTEVRAA